MTLDYIAQDSPARARKFKNDILARIKEIPKNPFLYRKSIYFDTVDIRDLIVKGYTIVFRITAPDRSIRVGEVSEFANRLRKSLLLYPVYRSYSSLYR